MQKNRYCCGITLFNPAIEDIKNVKDKINNFEKIYLYDNTETENNNSSFFENDASVEYISFGENSGLSKAYNYICDKAIIENFDFICLLDQDSLYEYKEIENMKSFINESSLSDIAIFAPYIHFSYYSENKVRNLETKDVEWVISSGSFINLNINEKNLKFDENYFIDRVDKDFCINLKQRGYKIIQYNGSVLTQNLGEKLEKISSYEHPPIRHYYLTRNRIYFYKKNKKQYKFYKGLIIGSQLKQILNVLLHENKKIQKLKMMSIGAKHYYQGKMGKY